MDAMVFGMGMSCLQVTFQARHIGEARHLYDNLGCLTPIMLALTANTPFYRGLISDQDVRWNVISGSVDDRTDDERDPKSENHILKSRYASISRFISNKKSLKSEYNDLPTKMNEEAYEALTKGGVDEVLAAHLAHLWIRDPLVIYKEYIQLDDEKSSNHFENIQSTNWQSMRFKPPPADDPKIGWRVEFRPMEVQLTDFENAAFTVFIALVSRAVLFHKLNLYMPISCIDDNMDRAHGNNAVRTARFHWRKVVKTKGSVSTEEEDELAELSVSEIMCGKTLEDGAEMKGIIHYVREYLDSVQCDKKTMEAVEPYLNLVEGRACGKLLTGAQWQRRFVRSHKAYKKDSVITDEICRDLVDEISNVVHGVTTAPDLVAGNLVGSLPRYTLESPQKAAILKSHNPAASPIAYPGFPEDDPSKPCCPSTTSGATTPGAEVEESKYQVAPHRKISGLDLGAAEAALEPQPRMARRLLDTSSGGDSPAA